MNDLLELVRTKDRSIQGVRNQKGYIEVKIPCIFPDSEIAWIPYWQATFEVEKMVRAYMRLSTENAR